ELESQIKAKRILFLCEMGLDPGIDHMSALSLLDTIREKGGHVTSFISHCGGLVAPESDNNPWHYKISWNPRNVVTAGREGAKFKQGGDTVVLNQQEIFSEVKRVSIEGAGEFAWYPNRDSLSYISLYGLEQTKNFIRTTLRHPGYVKAWKNILELELTHDKPVYTLSHPNLKKAFDHHFSEAGKTAKVDQLQSEDAGFAKQLQFLGVADEETILPFENFTPAQLLQFSLENKLLLAPQDKDMIVMLHEINYQLAGKSYEVKSSLVVKGTDAFHTAMAKTVGLPLGIMASLLLKEKIKLIGLKVPIEKEIYQPVLAALEAEGICFRDTEALLAD
ncbi:MAG: saccharopine dehydrogenase C-terminal domain-containing protein, partial [Chitinophagaceae bacterium]